MTLVKQSNVVAVLDLKHPILGGLVGLVPCFPSVALFTPPLSHY